MSNHFEFDKLKARTLFVQEPKFGNIKTISMDWIWDPEMCRVCLTSSTENIDLRTPFKKNEDFIWLEILNMCTCLDAQTNDDLPKSVCHNCSLHLEIAFDFCQKAKKADELLRSQTYDTYETESLKLKHEFKEELIIKNEKDEEEEESSITSCIDSLNNFENKTNIDSHLIDLDVVHYVDFENHENDVAKKETNLDIDYQLEDHTKEHPSEEMENMEETNFIETFSKKDKICIECGKSFVRTSTLQKHIREKHCNMKEDAINDLVECDLCAKPLKRWSLPYHKLRFHSNGRTFLCNACPKRFFTNNDLKMHLRTHDEKRERNFPCSICSKSFFDKQACVVHEQRHTGIKPFECSECEKRFFSQKALEVHFIVHNREIGKHECNVCRKHFASNVDLVVHMRFHTGIFPFKCDQCDKSFAVKSHYNYHIAKHKGVVYNCSHCSKQFTNRGSLTSHMLRHRDKMPHTCEACKKGFPTPFRLNRHMQSHHNKTEKLEQRKDTGFK